MRQSKASMRSAYTVPRLETLSARIHRASHQCQMKCYITLEDRGLGGGPEPVPAPVPVPASKFVLTPDCSFFLAFDLFVTV